MWVCSDEQKDGAANLELTKLYQAIPYVAVEECLIYILFSFILCFIRKKTVINSLTRQAITELPFFLFVLVGVVKHNVL